MKAWKEWYFLSEPRSFGLTHLPMEGDTLLQKEQYSPKPYTAEKLVSMALVSPQASVYGIRAISHQQSVIDTNKGHVVIQYECGFPLHQYLVVTRHETFENEIRTQRVQGQACLVSETHKHAIIARFSSTGKYRIRVFGSIKTGHQLLETSEALFDYMIHNTGVYFPGFPQELQNNTLGATAKFKDAGFKILRPKEGIVTTDTGEVRIEVKFPTAAILPNLFAFTYIGSGEERMRCNS